MHDAAAVRPQQRLQLCGDDFLAGRVSDGAADGGLPVRHPDGSGGGAEGRITAHDRVYRQLTP